MREAKSGGQQRRWRRGLRRPVVVVVFGVLLFFMPARGASAAPSSSSDCLSCHEPLYRQGLAKHYVHTPFARKRCERCHLAAREPGHQPVAGHRSRVEPLRWLYRRHQPGERFWLVLAASEAAGPLLLRSQLPGQTFDQQLILPRPEELPLWQEAGPPVIDLLQVSGVARELLASASIDCRTDILTRVEIRYGLDDRLRQVVADPGLARRHRLQLTGLRLNHTYFYQAVITDLAGHQVRSPLRSFSTSHARAMPSAEARPPVPGKKATAVTVRVQAYRLLTGDCLLRLEADQPVRLALGMAPARRPGPGAKLPPQHPRLADPYTLAISACLSCHPWSGHPYQVKPPPWMKVPARYRRLADGRLSCMTCHEPHASDNPFRLPTAEVAELCVGCHTDKTGVLPAQAGSRTTP